MNRLAVVLILVIAPVLAQDDPAQLRDRALPLLSLGKYGEAEPLLVRALEVTQKVAGA
jgi:hypothetical protein